MRHYPDSAAAQRATTLAQSRARALHTTQRRLGAPAAVRARGASAGQACEDPFQEDTHLCTQRRRQSSTAPRSRRRACRMLLYDCTIVRHASLKQKLPKLVLELSSYPLHGASPHRHSGDAVSHLLPTQNLPGCPRRISSMRYPSGSLANAKPFMFPPSGVLCQVTPRALQSSKVL